MNPIPKPHTVASSTDMEIRPVPVSRSLLSRMLTRIRLWRSRFKRKDRQQVPPSHTVEDRVSDIDEGIQLDLDEYLGTPIALTSPSFSVRSSSSSGVFDLDSIPHFGDGLGGLTHAYTTLPGSFTPSNVLGLQGLSQLTVGDADGVLQASASPELSVLKKQLEVYFLRTWDLVTYRFALGFALNQRLFDWFSLFSSCYPTGIRSTSN